MKNSEEEYQEKVKAHPDKLKYLNDTLRPPQLCRSKVKEGKYDSLIKFMILSCRTKDIILHEVMILTKGHENPKTILEQIQKLRDEYETKSQNK